MCESSVLKISSSLGTFGARWTDEDSYLCHLQEKGNGKGRKRAREIPFFSPPIHFIVSPWLIYTREQKKPRGKTAHPSVTENTLPTQLDLGELGCRLPLDYSAGDFFW